MEKRIIGFHLGNLWLVDSIEFMSSLSNFLLQRWLYLHVNLFSQHFQCCSYLGVQINRIYHNSDDFIPLQSRAIPLAKTSQNSSWMDSPFLFVTLRDFSKHSHSSLRMYHHQADSDNSLSISVMKQLRRSFLNPKDDYQRTE